MSGDAKSKILKMSDLSAHEKGGKLAIGGEMYFALRRFVDDRTKVAMIRLLNKLQEYDDACKENVAFFVACRIADLEGGHWDYNGKEWQVTIR